VSVLVIGSANMDAVMRVAALPGRGETVLSGDPVLRPGGKGANQAVAAALAGARVRMAGRLGDDAHGAAVRETLARAGVDTGLLATDPEHPTGTAVVLVADDGENAIVVAPGANHAITVEDVDALRGPIAEARVVLLQLELPVDAVARAASLAHATATVVLNLAPAVDVPGALLRDTDVLVLNGAEAAHLAGTALPDLDALERAAARLRERGPGTVVVTAGADGAVVADAEGTERRPSVPATDVVDTAGAGDAFAGVLAAGLGGGAGVREALGPALAAGAAAVAVEGAQLPLPPAR
jgi:ribokinase